MNGHLHHTPGPLTVRWTLGDVAPYGFEALRLSLWGARRIFGPSARYVVCVNSIPLDRARALVGQTPPEIEWRAVTEDDLPGFLRDHLDGGLAEGVGWKFAPLRVAPDDYELSLDNDCIFWEEPPAIRRWLESRGDTAFVLAEDVRRMLGAFSDLCSEEPRNGGIRGLPPGFDLGEALQRILERKPVIISSELDEQGLQVAAIAQFAEPLVVRADAVTICSPFPPLRKRLGLCGAHFVGLNAKSLPWKYYDRPAVACVREHWERLRDEIADRVGLHGRVASVPTVGEAAR